MNWKKQNASTGFESPVHPGHRGNVVERQRRSGMPTGTLETSQLSAMRGRCVKYQQAVRSQLFVAGAENSLNFCPLQMHEEMRAEDRIEQRAKFDHILRQPATNILFRMFPSGDAHHGRAGIKAAVRQVQQPATAASKIQNFPASYLIEPTCKKPALLSVNIASIGIAEPVGIIIVRELVVVINQLPFLVRQAFGLCNSVVHSTAG